MAGWPMEAEQAVGLVAIVWLIAALLLMARVIARGRALADELAARHPQFYAASGRPRPGYFHSTRRNRFAQFVAQREYDGLEDPSLAAKFDAHRKSEARTLLVLLISLVVVFLLILAVSYVA